MTTWLPDNPPSQRWTLYTRGNVGEVFPEVVLPLTWDLYGEEAEIGWREAYEDLGLVAPGDFDAEESMVILGVFGGYCYINASYVRMLGVRAPGGTVEAIDSLFFGESDAPPYTPEPGHKNLRSTAKLARTVQRLLWAKELPELEADKRRTDAWIDQFPGDDADDDALIGYLVGFKPLFRHLFRRHINNTMGVALVSGLLGDLLAKVGKEDRMVSMLGGIGDVESAAPSAAMWALAHSDHDPESEAWQAEFADFLDRFGSRGPNEWDLGSQPWALEPSRALAAIDRMRGAAVENDPAVQAERLARQAAIDVAEARQALNPIDRRVFDRALSSTTLYSQARERSKTTIIKAVHSARVTHRVLAERAAARGGPVDPLASCLLEVHELRQFMTDPIPWLQTTEERAELHQRLSTLEPPFVFDGTPPPIEEWAAKDATHETVAAGAELQGIAGCAGVARGRAVVVLEPGDPGDLGPGDVLIAPITDPSWTPLFLSAEAVVVDVGATMSHAVIVSRELGIPCVVSATGATRSIPNGATVEVDGNSGRVTVIDLP